MHRTRMLSGNRFYRPSSVLRALLPRYASGTFQDGYDAHRVEAYWQSQEASERPHQAMAATPGSKYCLSMFPYPSGRLHMGHVRVYTISDTLARFYRLQNYDVLHPMGWDAFGLPAENAAIERGLDPASWTRDNVAFMREQMDRLGLRFDWEREVNTSQPEYYKWTQWLFLQLYRHGLVYAKHSPVNWDPVDGTVLANEQVDSRGRSWRSGALVERRMMRQWYIRTTAYAEDLLTHLQQLSRWPDFVCTQQRHWIGASDGCTVEFALESSDPAVPSSTLPVFTTRVDTLYGVTFVAVALSHPMLDALFGGAGLSESLHKARLEAASQQGVGSSATDAPREPTHLLVVPHVVVRHPLTGESLPLVAADYVLADYGEAAVMAVPAHDARDAAAARLLGWENRVVSVVEPIHPSEPEEQKKKTRASDATVSDQTSSAIDSLGNTLPFTGKGRSIHSGPFSGLSSQECAEKITEELTRLGKGRRDRAYRLRDWLISRQRYWGTPIPMVRCPTCGDVPVPEDQLPVVLPPNVPLTGRGGSPLAQVPEFVQCTCPKCGGAASRETDTMDTFIDSSWYYLRYVDPQNSAEFCSPEKLRDTRGLWPVSLYIGGSEHAILHLLYARFINHFLHRHYGVPTAEPFLELLTQGMVQGQTFSHPDTGMFVRPEEVVHDADGRPVHAVSGDRLNVSYEKMSKSKYNGVEPGPILDRYGADATRLFTLFKAPPELELEWEEHGIIGQQRWIHRLWRLSNDVVDQLSASSLSPSSSVAASSVEDLISSDAKARGLVVEIHSAIAAVTRAMESSKRSLNTAVAALMKLSNVLAEHVESHPLLTYLGLRSLLILLHAMAPHVSAELWSLLVSAGPEHRSAWAGDSSLRAGSEPRLDAQSWPVADERWLLHSTVSLVVQVAGKKRAVVDVPLEVLDLPEAERDVELRRLAQPAVASYLGSKEPRRVVISQRSLLVNFVPG